MNLSQPGKDINRIEDKGFDHFPYVYMTLNHALTIQSTNLRGTLELEGEEGWLTGLPFLNVVVPSDRTLVQDYFEVMNDHNRDESEWECRLYSKQGKANWYQVYVRKNDPNDVKGFYELFLTNCSKLKMYEQFLAGEKEVLEAIAKNWSLHKTLDLLAQVVESVSEQGFCSILLVDQDGKTLLHGGAPSLPKAFNKYVSGRKIGPSAGSCGTAVYRKKAVLVSDIETHPFWENSRGIALRFGLKACLSNPIINHQGKVIGTLAMYYKKKHTPTAHELKAIRFFTHLAELAITHSEIRALEIQVSEEKYRMITENTSDLIALIDREGVIEFASPSFKEVLGVFPKYLMGKNLFELDFPLKGNEKARLKQAIRSKVPQKFLLELTNLNGQEVFIESNSAPILNQEGNIEKTVVVSRDITDRQQAQEEISRLHQQTESILQAAGDGIFGLDINAQISFCNHTAATLLGYKIEELIGRSVHETIYYRQEDHRGAEDCSMYLSMKEKRTIRSDKEVFSKKEGTLFLVEYLASPIIEEGVVTGTVVTFRDITERQEEERRQKKKEKQFRLQQQVLQELHAIIHDLPLKQAIELITERSVEVLNVERASVWLLSKENDYFYCHDLYERSLDNHTDGRRMAKEKITQLKEILSEDRVFIFKHGQEWVEEIHRILMLPETISSILMAPLYSGKQVIGMVSFALKEDVGDWDYDEQNFASAVADLLNLIFEKEERLKAEELLRKTEKLSIVGQLAAGVAHEIRNPLTSLKGFLQLLKERNETPDNSPFYDIMLSEIDRIHFISGELLFLAKPQAGKFGLFDLVTCLNHVISLFETEANLYNIQLQLDNHFPKNFTAKINGDQNQVKQVLVNIIKNGIEAMPSGGPITIGLDLEGKDHIRIKVKDQGKGIPKDRLAKLGEPFYTTKEKGTGLGLMVSSRIVETHRGTIQFDSTTGEGTTVTLIFPLGLD
jgi:PAS domain S-box-containing protein